MNEQEQLANYYRETKEALDEQRRIIDYDMKNTLVELESDKSTQGNLKTLRYRTEIEKAEVTYEDRVMELKQISDDVYPLLKEINAHRNDPFVIHIEDRTYFDIFINEDKNIQVSRPYTKI